MKFAVTLKKTADYGKQALGHVLERGGQRLRRVSNRLTTYALKKEYYKSAPYSLSAMLANRHPRYFGEKGKTAFIAAPSCQKIVDEFLSKAGWSRTPAELKMFRNGESYARIQSTVRDKTVVIFQDFKRNNINDALMETLLAIDAAKRASARRVILVCPGLPYIGDAPGTQNHKIDYFKLVLNLLFKAVHLDQLRVGNIVLSRGRSMLFLQDRVLSRNLAPAMINWSVHFDPQKERASEKPVFLIGRNYRASAGKIVDLLSKKHGLAGEIADFGFVTSPAERKINCGAESVPSLLGRTVYIFQTANTGRINDDLMETLLMVYSARKKGAKKIVLMMPFLPYNRQDRKAKTREAISAKMVANALVEAAGVNQMITFDLHADATQGFVDIPFQHITALHQVARFVKERRRKFDLASGGWFRQKLVPSSPDVGRAKAVRKLGKAVIRTAHNLAIVDKSRPEAGEARVEAVVGKVGGRDTLLYDDMIDSGGSIINAVTSLHDAGSVRVYVAAIHPVFSDVKIDLFNKDGSPIKEAFEEYENICGFLKSKNQRVEDHVARDEKAFTVNALIRLQAHPYIAGIIFTDSINVPPENVVDRRRVKIISISPLIASVLSRIMTGESLQDIQYEGE